MKPSSPSATGNDHVLQQNGCCISTILRRILCFSSHRRLPWCHFNHHHHQRQHLLEDSIIQNDHREEEEKKKSCSLHLAGSAAPGLVARLMGLESLPHEKEPSGDQEKQPLLTNSPRSKKTRMKSRIKVIPTYQELEEDENFYILRFGYSKVDDEENNRHCRKKKSMSRKRRKGDNKENEGVIMNTGSKGINVRPLKNYNSSGRREKAAGQVRTRNTKDSAKEADDALMVDSSEQENSSPNSVLEFVDEFPADDDDQTTACSSGNDISRLANSKMRRTLSEELENCRKPKHKHLQRLGKEEDQNLKKTRQQQKIINADDFLTGTKLAAMYMATSTWIQEELMLKDNQKCLKETARDVASDILDDLILDELITMTFS